MARQDAACLAAGDPALRRDAGQCRQIGRAGDRKRDRQAGVQQQDGKPDFGFFRRTSAELCAAILQPNELTAAVLRQYLARIDDDRLKRAFAAAIEAGQPKASSAGKPFKRDRRPVEGAFLRGATIRSRRGCAARPSAAVPTSRAAGGCAIEKMLFAPFRSGTAHVVIFRPVFPARPVPGWTEKRHHGADDAAQKGNKNGCGERETAACDAPREKLNSKRRAGWPALLIRALGRLGFARHPIIARAGRSEYREARARAPCGAASNWRSPRSWFFK